MYGLPKDTDLTFLVRQRLERVDVYDAQAQLHFTGTVSVSVEADCLIDNELVEYGQLTGLTGGTVFGVTIQDGGRLNLLFEDGRRLSLLDSNEGYESYQVSAPGTLIVV